MCNEDETRLALKSNQLEILSENDGNWKFLKSKKLVWRLDQRFHQKPQNYNK
jgi:hypothetical protein